MSNPPPTRIFAGIAAAAGAVLMLEIGLTRIFSYTIWYHFAYLTISVALLGFGASGSVLAAWPRLRERRGFLSGWAIAAQLGIFLCLLVVDRVALDPLSIASDPGQFARLLLYYVAVAVPFFAGGFLVAAPLQSFPGSVSRLYFWDLVGAGLACGFIVPLVWWLGTPAATALATVALAFATWAYAEPEIRVRRTLVAAGVAAATLALAWVGSFPAAPTKFVSRYLAIPGAKVAYSRWTPINRVDVVSFDPLPDSGSYGGWGISPFYRGRLPGYYMIGNDGDSCAVMYNWNGDFASLDFLKHHVLRVPYLLLEDPEVVAIGLGGGADVLNALNNQAKSVVGVEINPITVHAARELFSDFNGDLLNLPNVEVVVAEGRSFLRSRAASYDLIEINSVDTLSALSTGAYVLSESFLYTSDAVEDYLEHLKPGGLFAMAVGDLMGPNQPPRHTLRLASIVRKALEDRGVKEPLRHVMVVGTGGALPFTHTLVKNEPFTTQEVAKVAAFLQQEGFAFWHRPDVPPETVISRILSWAPATLEHFYATHDLNLAPTTDASPFFFNFYKWRTLAKAATYQFLGYDRTQATGQIVLVIMLLQSIVFGAAAIFLPLRRVTLASGGSARRRLAFLGYFMALGTGFILLEISFIQRFVLFLGYPTYSLTVVMLSLLVSTGLGSLLTERIQQDFAAALPPRLGLLLLLVVAYLLGTPWVFDALLGVPLALRVVVSVALIVPLGLVLGSFFPLGIRMAERVNPRLVPWGWAVNGCATVVGTLLAVMAGMTWSFTVVALAAAAIYVLGVLGLFFVERGAASAGRA
jgi:predicted membrane-bound spermidine synthase